MLLDATINVNKQDCMFYTPFHYTCQHGHIEIVKLLLQDTRVDVNKLNVYGTAFALACKKGDIEIVKLLLQNLRVDVNKTNIDGYTPFHYACQHGHIEIVKLLLQDTRVDVNKATSIDHTPTPFYAACKDGHIEIVKLLLQDTRVDVNTKNYFNMTPLFYVWRMQNIEVLKLLLQDPRVDLVTRGSDIFSLACDSKCIEIVKLLLQDTRVDIIPYTNTKYADYQLYLCEVAKEILLSNDSVSSVSKISTLMKNIKLILAAQYNQLGQSQSGLQENESITTTKEKLQISESALMLTLMVFLSDDYLTIKADAAYNIKRFFKITTKLPLDLQHLLVKNMTSSSAIPSEAVAWASKLIFLSFDDPQDDVAATGET